MSDFKPSSQAGEDRNAPKKRDVQTCENINTKTLTKRERERDERRAEKLEADAREHAAWCAPRRPTNFYRPSEITVDPNRPTARPLDMTFVEALAEDIRLVGLKTPIEVEVTYEHVHNGKGQWGPRLKSVDLVEGVHRLAAWKLVKGDDFIECYFKRASEPVDADDDDADALEAERAAEARLREYEALGSNGCRKELDIEQKAKNTARRIELRRMLADDIAAGLVDPFDSTLVKPAKRAHALPCNGATEVEAEPAMVEDAETVSCNCAPEVATAPEPAPVKRMGRPRNATSLRSLAKAEGKSASTLSRHVRIAKGEKLPKPKPKPKPKPSVEAGAVGAARAGSGSVAEQHWQQSLANHAGDAASMRAFWKRQHGNWENFEVQPELVTLTEQAAEAWTELAKTLSAPAVSVVETSDDIHTLIDTLRQRLDALAVPADGGENITDKLEAMRLDWQQKCRHARAAVDAGGE